VISSKGTNCLFFFGDFVPDNEVLLTFLIATAVFAYMPGPSTLYAATQTIARGKKAGWLAAAGIHIGGYLHVVAAALGLSVLFTSVPALFVTIKLAGAAYLVWLGIQLIRSNADLSESFSQQKPSQASHKPLWESITVEILNPKTAIFYIAFLPQFTDPAVAMPIWAQLLVLGTIVNIMFSSADVFCVLLSSTVVRYFKQSPGANKIVQRTGGSVLIALGINLALSRQ
jgi:threonine/homoserine/homoserine lactone efflux protein